jgi:hypothetical protein
MNHIRSILLHCLLNRQRAGAGPGNMIALLALWILSELKALGWLSPESLHLYIVGKEM